MSFPPTTSSRSRRVKRILVWLGGISLVLLVAGLIAWRHRFHGYTPLDALTDLRIGAQVRHSPHPARDFLELRYGPQTESANREKAFIDLFNAGHIEGLYLTVGNRTDPRTRQLIGDVAQIIAGYRQRMTPAEKASLGNYFFSPAGRAQIHDATGSYQSKSPQFRAVAAPVIQEILTTLTTLPATTKP